MSDDERTDLELLQLLREGCSWKNPAVEEVFDELEARATERVTWPEPVFDAALEVFGPPIYARTGKTRRLLDGRIQHALAIWRDRYGVLSPEQADYAARVLAYAIGHGAGQATNDRERFQFVLATITRMVNHEKVHDGFLRRARGHRIDVVGELVS